MDKILIRNLRAHGIIGVYAHEREIPQDILINIILYTDIRQAAQSDSIKDCINYDTLSQKIRTHAEKAQRLTVEALAEDIAKLCLREVGVKKTLVRVEKPEAMDFVEKVGVEIERP
ncbi:MAG: dihydroneopterin aldolase [Anaerolineae bacterium]|jgi:FolB domain-containing protein|nr:dihydroneopterin aldolase [Anaerolineae bacterium]MBT4309440.1 dihydroneopterin aldolase [Anaerolineae bacterium]MBT4458284.1 dihydroneopterin aldolase [Anaerolineae bacterium]MBT4840961.1 dihydroneopterin aldolase [Anaerolineae bacterium]MBT6061165.1 dihydroneopterin aldolase [Anaerolineae bacterium]